MTDNSAVLGPSQFIAAVYPEERQRAHAERWLGLLALQADDQPLTWWRAMTLAPLPVLLNLRLLVCGLLITAMFIPGFVFVLMNDETRLVLAALTLIAMWGTWTWSVRKRLDRGADADKPWISAAGSYQAARRDCLRRALAWAPAGALVGLVSGPPHVGLWVLLVAAVYSAGIALLAAVRTGTYPLAWFAEVLLAAGWGERAGLAALLEDAAGRMVLREVKGGYEFQGNLRDYLARQGTAILAEHRQLIMARLAAPWVRRAVIPALTRAAMKRVMWDAAVGAGVATAILGIAILRFYGNLGHWGWILALPAAAMAAITGAITFFGLRLAAWLARLAVACIPGWPRDVRVFIVADAVVIAALLVAFAGSALAAILAFCLPLALVAGCGGWACALALRRTRDSTRRWLRLAPDLIAVATVAALLLVLVRHALLTAGPAAGLLFPVAAWGTVRLWRAMAGSPRLAVKAAANLVGSLLLGGELVLLLVWLANVLRFSAPVVAALRWWLEQVGSRADLPWWTWTGLYAVLAALGVAIVRWPDRMRGVASRVKRLRVIPAADVSQQVLTCVHIGLLAIVLVGLAAPPAVGAVLRRQLPAAYLVALQRELDDAAARYAYQEIAAGYTAAPATSTLTALVTKISDVAGPGDPRQGATSTEEELARRVGEAQAGALALPPLPSLADVEQQAAAAAGFTEPSGGAAAEASTRPGPSASGGATQASFTEEADTTSKLDEADEESDKQVEEAADLAAKLVASTISIPSASDNEVFQVVREYLSGLIEGSRLTDAVAAWLHRLPGAAPPPAPDAEVNPDPARLKAAATATLSEVTTEQGMDDPVTDPNDDNDFAYQSAQGEDQLDAAVDIVNDARYAQDPTGPCDSCIAPGIPDTSGLERALNDLSTPEQGEEPGEEPEEPAVHEP
jgi:hypothetical protein